MTTTTTDTVKTLNDLIKISKDGEYGFHSCAEHAKSTQMKSLFERRAHECHAAAEILQEHVYEMGGSAEARGSISGAVHRGWVALKSTLSTYDDLALLEECERGEDAARDEYQEALRADLPMPIRNLLERQYEAVQRNHEEIRALRDSAKAARG